MKREGREEEERRGREELKEGRGNLFEEWFVHEVVSSAQTECSKMSSTADSQYYVPAARRFYVGDNNYNTYCTI